MSPGENFATFLKDEIVERNYSSTKSPPPGWVGCAAIGCRLLLKDPGERGGGGGWGPGQPTHPPTHIRKIILGQKMKFINGAGNLGPILGMNFFWPLAHPAGGGGGGLAQGLGIRLFAFGHPGGGGGLLKY